MVSVAGTPRRRSGTRRSSHEADRARCVDRAAAQPSSSRHFGAGSPGRTVATVRTRVGPEAARRAATPSRSGASGETVRRAGRQPGSLHLAPRNRPDVGLSQGCRTEDRCIMLRVAGARIESKTVASRRGGRRGRPRERCTWQRRAITRRPLGSRRCRCRSCSASAAGGGARRRADRLGPTGPRRWRPALAGHRAARNGTRRLPKTG